jgi:tetratricopeptide (TPR) repeat protein
MFRLRGDLFTIQKNYPAAVKDYNKALTLKKDDVAILLSRGNCYFVQGKTKFMSAELDYKKVLELEPKNAAASRGLGKIRFEQEKWQEAIDYFNTAIANGASGEDYFYRAKCNYKLNKKKDCCADFDKAAQLGFPGVAEEKKLAGCQ